MKRIHHVILGLCLLMTVFGIAVVSAADIQGENPFGNASSDAFALKGDIYYLAEGTPSLPDFAAMTPVGSIYTKVLDIPSRSFSSGFPGVSDRFEWFALRYTGSFVANRSGTYAFRLVSDDGSRLVIDGTRIIDNDGIHGPQSASGSVNLTAGQHQIEVDYFQGPREYIALQLFWTPPGGTEVISNPTYVPLPTGSVTSTPPQAIDLTGVWSCDRGGTYYIRQLGTEVWWYGELASKDPYWSNVAHGTLQGTTLALNWSDVPKGCVMSSGTLVIDVVTKDSLKAREKTGGFGSSSWTRIASTACGGLPTTTTTQPTSTPIVIPLTTLTSSTSSPWESATVRSLIDEWLDQQEWCAQEIYPDTYIDEWGRLCGETPTTRLICTLDPDHPADWDNYHYLWANNGCPTYYGLRVTDYVALRQNGWTYEDLNYCKDEEENCY